MRVYQFRHARVDADFSAGRENIMRTPALQHEFVEKSHRLLTL